MKKLIGIIMALCLVMAGAALAQTADATATNQDTTATGDTDEAKVCCMAMTADCLACQEGISVAAYCKKNPETAGCVVLNEERREEITKEYRKEAEELKEQFIATYGNDTEALRNAYKERAREMIQQYQGDIAQLANEYRAQSAEELRGFIQAQQELAKAELEESQEKIKARTKERIQEENQVRIAVHTLLAMENLTGGIGENVSAVARQMQNRAEIATDLKEKAQETRGLQQFFVGGDRETAQELHQEASFYEEKIQQLKKLQEQADDDESVTAILADQIEALSKEQNRLEKHANKEDNRGLLGWLWKKKVASSTEE